MGTVVAADPLAVLGLSADDVADLSRRFGAQTVLLVGAPPLDGLAAADGVELLVRFRPHARATLLTLEEMEEEMERLLGRPVHLNAIGGLRGPDRQAVLDSAFVLYAD